MSVEDLQNEQYVFCTKHKNHPKENLGLCRKCKLNKINQLALKNSKNFSLDVLQGYFVNEILNKLDNFPCLDFGQSQRNPFSENFATEICMNQLVSSGHGRHYAVRKRVSGCCRDIVQSPAL